MEMDAQKVVQTLIQSELTRVYPRGEARYRPIITVSREYGSGGEEIARRLAEHLGVEFYDRQILDAVAEEAKVNPLLMESLDQKGQEQQKETWLYNFLTGQNAFLAGYRHHLVNVVLGIARQGGIIMGRGGHVILANRDAFRLRLVGSEGMCVQRIVEREGLTSEAAGEKVRRINRERDQALYSLFKRHLYEANLFDLVLNTDKLAGWDSAVSIILEAMRAMGFHVNEHHHG